MIGGPGAKIWGSGANHWGFRVKIWSFEAKIWCSGITIMDSRAKSQGSGAMFGGS